MSSVFTLYN